MGQSVEEGKEEADIKEISDAVVSQGCFYRLGASKQEFLIS